MMVVFDYQWGKTTRLCNSHVSLFIKSFSSSKHLETAAGSPISESYLINSCGFSLEAAKSLSKRVSFANPKKPDSVIEFLKKYGFTNTQINNMIRTTPDVLVARPVKTLLPKLEFFQSVGMSNSEISELVSSSAQIWRRSLKKQIIPSYNFLKKMLIGNSTIVRVLKRAFILNYSLIPPNIMILQRVGVPESSISYLLRSQPNVLCKTSMSFDKDVKKVIEMGWDPLERGFVRALGPVSGLSENSWKHKFDVYMKLGWSEDELRSVFRKQPMCMGLSEENITRKMCFLVNNMGYTPTDIAKSSVVILHSIDKRIVPRCSVIKALLMQGLIKEKPALSSLLYPSDSKFMDKFVRAHHDQSAELLNIFQGKVKLFVLAPESGRISEKPALSEENIKTKMDFLVSKMGYTRAYIAKQPVLIRYSLDKRIIPRWSVLKALLMRGLIKKKPALSSLLTPSDRAFMDKFVLAHHHQSAELLNIFQGNVKLFVLPPESGRISEVKLD